MARPIGGWLRGLLGVAIATAWAIGGSASTAAPLRLVTDQLPPLENLSDAEAPGFSTEVLRQVFRGERDALFTALRNDERVRFCHFPNEPLLREKWVFFVRAADAGRLK